MTTIQLLGIICFLSVLTVEAQIFLPGLGLGGTAALGGGLVGGGGLLTLPGFNNGQSIFNRPIFSKPHISNWNDIPIRVSKPSTTTTTTTTKAPKPLKPKRIKIKLPKRKSSDCGYTTTFVNGERRCSGELIFNENFYSLQDNIWSVESGAGGEPDNEFVVYQDKEENLFVNKGILNIRPLSENNLPIISAQVSTKETFSFKYGIIEVGARLPEGDWIYPEIYLQPESDPGCSYCSITIAFTPGNAALSKTLSSGVLLGKSESARTQGMKYLTDKDQWNSNSHIFRLKWTPDNIVVYIDNKEYGEIKLPIEGFGTQSEMFVKLGVGVGGQRFPDSIPNKPWKNQDPKAKEEFLKNRNVWKATWGDNSKLSVDYVKIWAL